MDAMTPDGILDTNGTLNERLIGAQLLRLDILDHTQHKNNQNYSLDFRALAAVAAAVAMVFQVKKFIEPDFDNAPAPYFTNAAIACLALTNAFSKIFAKWPAAIAAALYVTAAIFTKIEADPVWAISMQSLATIGFASMAYLNTRSVHKKQYPDQYKGGNKYKPFFSTYLMLFGLTSAVVSFIFAACNFDPDNHELMDIRVGLAALATSFMFIVAGLNRFIFMQETKGISGIATKMILPIALVSIIGTAALATTNAAGKLTEKNITLIDIGVNLTTMLMGIGEWLFGYSHDQPSLIVDSINACRNNMPNCRRLESAYSPVSSEYREGGSTPFLGAKAGRPRDGSVASSGTAASKDNPFSENYVDPLHADIG